VASSQPNRLIAAWWWNPTSLHGWPCAVTGWDKRVTDDRSDNGEFVGLLGGIMKLNSLPQTTVAFTAEDFIPMPSKPITHRGIPFSRSTLIRLWEAGEIKTTKLRVSGKVLGRRVILRESLDAFIDRQVAENLS